MLGKSSTPKKAICINLENLSNSVIIFYSLSLGVLFCLFLCFSCTVWLVEVLVSWLNGMEPVPPAWSMSPTTGPPGIPVPCSEILCYSCSLFRYILGMSRTMKSPSFICRSSLRSCPACLLVLSLSNTPPTTTILNFISSGALLHTTIPKLWLLIHSSEVWV